MLVLFLFSEAMGRSSIMVLGLLLLVAISSTSTPSFSSAELQKLEHPMKSDGSLSLLAVGDWGRNGTFNQSQVAFQMGRIGEELEVDFVISVGDNFYENGLASINDKSFKDDFTNVYTAKSLQKQWYAVLGNHDYMGNVLAQLDPALQKIDSRWLCKRSFTVDAEVAEFFFVDTSPFVKKYWKIPNKHHYDWRGVAPRKNYISKLLTDLESALAESTATWKIVIGHHAIRSVGENGDTKELVKKLLPMLKNHGVDLYINGHDHCLEQISSRNSPIQFITSGGGSKAWAGIFNPTVGKLRFFYDGQGFISLQLAKADAKVVFYDVLGAVRHQWSFTKQFKPI